VSSRAPSALVNRRCPADLEPLPLQLAPLPLGFEGLGVRLGRGGPRGAALALVCLGQVGKVAVERVARGVRLAAAAAAARGGRPAPAVAVVVAVAAVLQRRPSAGSGAGGLVVVAAAGHPRVLVVQVVGGRLLARPLGRLRCRRRCGRLRVRAAAGARRSPAEAAALVVRPSSPATAEALATAAEAAAPAPNAAAPAAEAAAAAAAEAAAARRTTWRHDDVIGSGRVSRRCRMQAAYVAGRAQRGVQGSCTALHKVQ